MVLMNWDGDDVAGFEIQERKFGQGCSVSHVREYVKFE